MARYEKEFCSFSFEECMIKIDSSCYCEIESLKIGNGIGSIRFMVFDSRSIDRINNFIGNKCEIEINGHNEIDSEFSIKRKVKFADDFHFEMSVGNKTFEIELDFELESTENYKEK